MKGFTLVELLVVIGIIVILMTAALVAINPFKQFAMANNANRSIGVRTMINAISQRLVDNRGIFGVCPTGATATNCPGTGDTVPTTATNMSNTSGDFDMCGCLVPEYMGAMPFDPQTGNYASCISYNTKYTIKCDSTSKRITVCAEDTQIPPESAKICITQ